MLLRPTGSLHLSNSLLHARLLQPTTVQKSPRRNIIALHRCKSAISVSLTDLQPRHRLSKRHAHNAAIIDPSSLSATLESHREENRSFLVRRLRGKDEERQPDLFRKIKGKGVKDQRLATAWKKRGENVLSDTPHDLDNEFSRPDAAQINYAKPPLAGALDYRGKPRDLMRQWRVGQTTSRNAQYPWLRFLHNTYSHAIEQLHAEIRAFAAYISPNDQERAAATWAIQDIFNCAQVAMPSIATEVAGSQATGLATPFSDLDFNLVPLASGSVATQPKNDASHVSAIQLLKLLRQQMQSERCNLYKPQPNPVKVDAFVERALVPIVAGHHRPTGLYFQIQSTNDTFISTQLTKDWLVEFPALHSLFMVLKQTLSMRGLTNGSAGGLTTYPLLGMIIAALRLSQGKVGRQDVAAQLLFFLDMYCDIDFYTQAISLNPLQYVSKIGSSSDKPELAPRDESGNATSKRQQMSASATGLEAVGKSEWMAPIGRRRYMMSLQDPANAYNDLGKGCTMIKHIQATFLSLRHKLRTAMQAWDEMDVKPRDIEDMDKPLLAPLVAGDYALFEDDRNELRRAILQKPREEAQ